MIKIGVFQIERPACVDATEFDINIVATYKKLIVPFSTFLSYIKSTYTIL